MKKPAPVRRSLAFLFFSVPPPFFPPFFRFFPSVPPLFFPTSFRFPHPGLPVVFLSCLPAFPLPHHPDLFRSAGAASWQPPMEQDVCPHKTAALALSHGPPEYPADQFRPLPCMFRVRGAPMVTPPGISFPVVSPPRSGLSSPVPRTGFFRAGPRGSLPRSSAARPTPPSHAAR